MRVVSSWNISTGTGSFCTWRENFNKESIAGDWIVNNPDRACLEGATECADITLPSSKPAYCQDDEESRDCAYLEQNEGECLFFKACSRCCSTCYEECCVQGGKCACAPGEYSDIDNTCKSCPVNSNSAMGSVGISSCKCNDGFEGPDGGPCTLPKYPPGGCSAGSGHIMSRRTGARQLQLYISIFIKRAKPILPPYTSFRPPIHSLNPPILPPTHPSAHLSTQTSHATHPSIP
jgi:hypothetical protein